MAITLEAMDAVLEKNIESLSTIFDHITQMFKKVSPAITIETIIDYGCSNVAKLFEKKIYIFKKKICMIFTKILFFSVKIFFFSNKVMYSK